MQCSETLSEAPLKAAALQTSPATLFHRTIQRRLTQGQVNPGRRARRRLFAAVDGDEVSRFVKRELAAIRAADRRRYNFDFEKMQPLEGRFQWEMVGDAVQGPCENTPSPLPHRSARRLELDCPRTGAVHQGRVGGVNLMESSSTRAMCSEDHRVCFLQSGDDSSEPLKGMSTICCDKIQNGIKPSRTNNQKPAPTLRLRQTVLTDLLQTRKRAGVWEAIESQTRKRLKLVSLSSDHSQLAEGQSEEERAGVPARQSALGQLQERGVVPS